MHRALRVAPLLCPMGFSLSPKGPLCSTCLDCFRNGGGRGAHRSSMTDTERCVGASEGLPGFSPMLCIFFSEVVDRMALEMVLKAGVWLVESDGVTPSAEAGGF